MKWLQHLYLYNSNYQFYQSNATDSEQTVYFTALLNRMYDLNLYISNDSGGYFAKIVYILPIYQWKDCSNTTYIKWGAWGKRK